MSDKTFVDTNILIYAHDIDSNEKQQVSKAILRELWSERAGVLSTQVLHEFYANVTKKISSPVSKELARRIVNSYAIWCTRISMTEIATAFQIEDDSQIGFWDALIVSSAVNSGASRILSEDLNPKHVVAGIRIENPFIGIR